MLPSLGSHAVRALTPQTAVTVDHSRCVRHRCKRNECSKCLEICPVDAITWDERGLHVSPGDCTQCLRCLSVCPTAALTSPELSLLQVFTDLAKHPDPVLGCNHSPDIKTHAQLSCLGFLADPELMLLLALVFRDGVQINLTRCEGCPNGHVLGDVHGAHDQLAALLPDHKVALIRNRDRLKYKPPSLSRRELFGFFRENSTRTAMVMVERLQVSSRIQSYGCKQVPQVRTTLLKAMETLPEIQRRVAEQLFGQIAFTETCTACGGCVGVCPTGAIDPSDEDKPSPVFDQTLCVSCGSCQAFCRKQGVQLMTASNQKQATSLASA
jgi:ferredoxin